MSVSQNPSGEFEATGTSSEEIELDLEQISEETGIPNYFDKIITTSLDGGEVAATTLEPQYDIDEITDFDPYNDDWDDLDFENYEVLIKNGRGVYGLTLEEFHTVFIADAENYAQIDDKSRYLADLHEMMHGSQFEGNWGEDIQEAEGVSDEMREYLDYVANMSYEEFLEGNTEAVTEAMIPNGKYIGRPFYPELTDLAEDELESQFELDEEFEHYDDSDILPEYNDIRVSDPVEGFFNDLTGMNPGAGA